MVSSKNSCIRKLDGMSATEQSGRIAGRSTVMARKVRNVRSADPDFKELRGSGRLVSGADIQALWHAWNAGEIPDPDAGNEVVQPVR
jgi:hypothetical protein